MTSTLLPLLTPQAAVAALTALVSASPELAISIFNATGPEAGAWVAGAWLKPPPPEHAAMDSVPTAPRATAARRERLFIDCIFILLFTGGAGLLWRGCAGKLTV